MVDPISTIPPSRVARDVLVPARRGEEAMLDALRPSRNEAGREHIRNPEGYGQFRASTASLLLGVSTDTPLSSFLGPRRNWLVSRLKVLLRWGLELLFPYRCLSCRQYLDREYICRRCFNQLPIRGQSECVGCGRPSSDGTTCLLCKEGQALDQLMIVSDFKDPTVAMLVKKMKYGFIRDIVEPLHRLSRKYLSHRAKKGYSFVQNNPLLVPVPLHVFRERWRGFNQAALLGERIADSYQLELISALRCTEHKTHQAEIADRTQRIENIRGLYKCTDPNAITGRTIILIDDVCTTGATLNECASVLKASGARFVGALVIARG